MRRSREDAFAFGNAGDELVRRALRAGGEAVFPNSDADKHGAPMATSQREKIIAPDLMAMARGNARLVEVKTKQSATLRQVTGIWETGCSLRHVKHYQAFERESGLRVWMVFVHVEEDEVLTNTLSNLMCSARIADDSGTIDAFGESMVFFRCNDLELLAKLSEIDATTRLVLEGQCPPKAPRTHSEVPHPGTWKTRQTARYTEYQWIPETRRTSGNAMDQLTRTVRASTPAREAQLARTTPRGVVLWDFTDEEDASAKPVILPEAAE